MCLKHNYRMVLQSSTRFLSYYGLLCFMAFRYYSQFANYRCFVFGTGLANAENEKAPIAQCMSVVMLHVAYHIGSLL